MGILSDQFTWNILQSRVGDSLVFNWSPSSKRSAIKELRKTVSLYEDFKPRNIKYYSDGFAKYTGHLNYSIHLSKLEGYCSSMYGIPYNSIERQKQQYFWNVHKELVN